MNQHVVKTSQETQEETNPNKKLFFNKKSKVQDRWETQKWKNSEIIHNWTETGNTTWDSRKYNEPQENELKPETQKTRGLEKYKNHKWMKTGRDSWNWSAYRESCFCSSGIRVWRTSQSQEAVSSFIALRHFCGQLHKRNYGWTWGQISLKMDPIQQKEVSLIQFSSFTKTSTNQTK